MPYKWPRLDLLHSPELDFIHRKGKCFVWVRSKNMGQSTHNYYLFIRVRIVIFSCRFRLMYIKAIREFMLCLFTWSYFILSQGFLSKFLRFVLSFQRTKICLPWQSFHRTNTKDLSLARICIYANTWINNRTLSNFFLLDASS